MSKKNIIVRILRFIITIIIGTGIGIAISSQNRFEIAELHRHAPAEAVLLERHLKGAVDVDRHQSQRGVHNLL